MIQSATSDQGTLEVQYKNIPFLVSSTKKKMNSATKWRFKYIYDKASMFKSIHMKSQFERLNILLRSRDYLSESFILECILQE